MKKSKNKLNKVVVIALFVILMVYAISMLFPLLWGFLTSLKSSLDFDTLRNVLGFPDMEYSKDTFFKLSNYTAMFKDINLSRSVSFFAGNVEIIHNSENTVWTMLFNSLLYSLGGSFVTTFVTMCMAYLCAKYKFKAASWIYAMVIVTMTIPTVGSYPATITLLRSLNLYDSWFGYFFQKFYFGGMYFLLFYAFYETLSDSYYEAAEIDGASQLRIMFSVMIPLSKTIFSTVVLIVFVQLWNDYQTPLLYMPTKPTLAYGIHYFTNKTVSGGFAERGEPGKIALCMLLAIPVLILFVALKDKIMGNITIGGIKG